MGKFVAADGGTIFLDEIGDMSARTQAKVLRVLQNGEVEPVGAERTIEVDVRVVAATNRNLEEEIAAGRFREDLFYRLNVIPVRTPALREHLEDLPLLVEHFVRRYADQNNYKAKEFGSEALAHLKALPWKGNVRELKNLIERLLILSAGDIVTREDVLAVTGGARPELLHLSSRRPDAARVPRPVRAHVPPPQAGGEQLERHPDGPGHRHAPEQPLQEAGPV